MDSNLTTVRYSEFSSELRFKKLNSNVHCDKDFIPDTEDYIAAIDPYEIILFTFGAFLVVVSWIAYLDTLVFILTHSKSSVKSHSASVIIVHPIVATAMYCALIVPRAIPLAEAVSHIVLAFGLYQLFCLYVAYCGGDSELTRKVTSTPLNMQVGPCCCWPCCFCLPKLTVDKNIIRKIKILVIQLPIVHFKIYLITLLMWANQGSQYDIQSFCGQVIILISTIIAVWAMVMTIQLLKDVLIDYRIIAKFIIMKCMLLFTKIQGLVTTIVIWTNTLPCNPPLTPTVYGKMIHGSFLIIQMTILAIIARKIYKIELPNCPKGQTMQPISTIGQIMNHNYELNMEEKEVEQIKV